MIKTKPQLIGFPYEEGSYWRKGSKEGPRKVFEDLLKMREYSIRSNQLLNWSFSELIDEVLEMPPYNKSNCLQQIEDKIYETLKNKRIPISIGGDHSITYPIIKAYRKYFGNKNFKIIQFDAHSDTFEDVDGYKYHHGATFRNILEEGLVSNSDLFQFGIRGQVRKDSLGYLKNKEITSINMVEFEKNSLDLSTYLIDKEALYYISIDIDVVDPSYAPGTGTPVPGGLTSREILKIIDQLKNYNIIGVDLVEVAPVYDFSNITSLLAANIISELITGYKFDLNL